MRLGRLTHFNILMMYASLLNRLLITVIACGLLLQGCGSGVQMSGESVLKKSRRASHDERATDQALVPGSTYFVTPDVPGSRLPTIASAALLSMATFTDQVASPTHRLAVRLDTVSWQPSLSTESEETDKKPAARSVAQVAAVSLVGCLGSLYSLPFSVPAPVFGAQAWRQYFGEVGEEPSLPSDIDEILDSPCKFWPGKVVKDTHLLVLIPSTVGGKAFTLDLLGELIQNPLGGSHRTQYFLYDDEVQHSSGDVYSSNSYWILLTRDVLPGSRNKPYEFQRALITARSSHVAAPPYEIPSILEAATAVLSHYVRSGGRLYEGGGDVLPSTSTRCTALLENASEHPSPFTVGRFCSRGLVFLSGFDDDAEFGVSCLRRFGSRHYRPSALLHSFGAEEWSQYFGEVGVAPPLPVNIVDTLNSACPFWPDRQVKDTHLLVLIPATVNGKPFSLNLLRELIQHPRVGGHSIKYHTYDSDLQEQFGDRSPVRSYWVLMTRDVLEGSRDETYASQKDLVAVHAERTGIPYEPPGALEAATVILSHYMRSGAHLYANNPWTYTRCQELVVDEDEDVYPVVIGGFSSKRLCVFYDFGLSYSHCGVASLRKF